MTKSNKQLSSELKLNYSKWKSDSLDSNGYFVVFNGFKTSNKLKQISGNALKLYIYLGINANNSTGEVWHSNSTIAKYFGKSERTIRTWMQELESLNLIKRMQLEFNQESHTFLQPYANNEQDKYIYIYRFKDATYREIVDLKYYATSIETAINNCLKGSQIKYYLKIRPSYFQISSFLPIPSKYLRSMGKKIKDSDPIFERFTKTYTYTKEDGTIASNTHLFERVKNKYIE